MCGVCLRRGMCVGVSEERMCGCGMCVRRGCV